MVPVRPAAPFDETSVVGPLDRAGIVTLAFAFGALALVVLAVAFDWLAVKGVLLVGFLSIALAYLIVPLVQGLRDAVARRTGRRPSRLAGATLLYLCVAIVALPAWFMWGRAVTSQVPDVAREVPRHVGRFVQQVRASERWHERFRVEARTRRVLRALSRGVSRRIEDEVREVGAEVVRGRRIVPWLVAVPVLAFVLVTRWTAFHRSAARGLPTPHLQWRTDQFLRHVNTVLAAYTRAQALSALFVGTVCGIGFALLQLPNAAVLGLVAGMLECIPIAGPLAVAISATAVAAPRQVVLVLAFLGAVRVVQDYVVLPRLVRRAMHLHPIAVVAAIWAGAAIGGIIGVCLAVPTVGILQVARRHWREYREIERLLAAPRA
jgi:predicted PurR-regulated permease PerM